MRAALLLAALISTPAAAEPRLTDADARAFVARQQEAWNARRLDAWFAAFTPDATFTDQAYNGAKPPVPYGTSTLKEARSLIRRAASTRETARVFRVTVAADGRSAVVVTSVGVQAGPRRLCLSRAQTLVATPPGLRSRGQTDTLIRCRNR